MSYDKVKSLKRSSRQQNQEYGKSGLHVDSRERRKPTMHHFMQDEEGSLVRIYCPICSKAIDLLEEPTPLYTNMAGDPCHEKCFKDLYCDESLHIKYSGLSD